MDSRGNNKIKYYDTQQNVKIQVYVLFAKGYSYKNKRAVINALYQSQIRTS